jgi:antitoxin component YwqK of YwqJK toxin-antitoxin module
MKYNLYILFILLTISTFGQIDTTKSIYKNLETKKFYSVGMCETTKNGVTEYQVNGKKVNAKVYKKYHKTWKNMETCTPCILMSYDENDILIRKSVCYTDCGVGQYIQYYKDGKIEIIGHYKENKTDSWDNLSDRGMCSEKHGTWTYYDKKGTITKTENYIDNKLIVK